MAALFQFENYIDQLIRELEAFPSDESIWLVPPGINNSPGNIGLHIAGNLQHFVGSILGKTGYVRHRDEEFTTKGLSKAAVIDQLKTAKVVVNNVLSKLSNEDRLKPYPELFKGKELCIDDALSHLLAHLAYHTGQVNYMRRMVHQ